MLAPFAGSKRKPGVSFFFVFNFRSFLRLFDSLLGFGRLRRLRRRYGFLCCNLFALLRGFFVRFLLLLGLYLPRFVRFPLIEDLLAYGVGERRVDCRGWRKDVKAQPFQFRQNYLILH